MRRRTRGGVVVEVEVHDPGCCRQKALIGLAYTEAAPPSLAVWGLDEAGLYQPFPSRYLPAATHVPESLPARIPASRHRQAAHPVSSQHRHSAGQGRAELSKRRLARLASTSG